MKYHASLFYGAVLTLFALSGCAQTNFRAHPQLLQQKQAIRTILLLEPDIKVLEVSAGGIKEQITEGSAQGARNVTQAIVSRLNREGITVKLLKQNDEAFATEIKESLALFNAVSWSIYLHTYNVPTLFPDKMARFDYSVGSLDALLQRENADALLLIQGADEVSTTGRKAVNVLKALTGVPINATTYLLAALADRTGDILWFNFYVGSEFDQRNTDSGAALIRTTLAGFPEVGR